MTKLEKIYKIKNLPRRHEALLRYAEVLKVKLGQARKESGACDYDKLTVLVYDAEQARLEILKKNIFFLCAGLAVFIILGWGIFLFFRLSSGK